MNDIVIDVQTERAILVAIRLPQQERFVVEEHLDELKELALTAGAEVVATVVQERPSPDSAFFIGKGKLDEIAALIDDLNAGMLIFDDELSPAQAKNVEQKIKVKVIDRTALILDIFADHAQSREAKTQVELAQLNYLLPRLTRQWQHLSRQVGGIGTKGPGETQLETDRRLVRNRISRLHSKLEEIERQGATRRQNRDTLFRVALVGYTNAGKSTLMNALTDSSVLMQNKLFATLDTTVRRMNDEETPGEILVSDTVGFIRKLPTQLVASFRTTLSEAREADLLLHVIDIAHPYFEEQIRVVNEVLAELDITNKQIIHVFNKVDILDKSERIEQMRTLYGEDSVFISAKKQIGVQTLKDKIIARMESHYKTRKLRLSYMRGANEHLVMPYATILDKSFDENFIYLTVKYPPENEYQIERIQKNFS